MPFTVALNAISLGNNACHCVWNKTHYAIQIEGEFEPMPTKERWNRSDDHDM